MFEEGWEEALAKEEALLSEGGNGSGNALGKSRLVSFVCQVPVGVPFPVIAMVLNLSNHPYLRSIPLSRAFHLLHVSCFTSAHAPTRFDRRADSLVLQVAWQAVV